jgi:hypothetical protein
MVIQQTDINLRQRITNTWLPLTLGEWLAAVPLIARQLPDDQHLPFLVRLFVALQESGVRLDEHLDCLVEALILESE